MFFTAILSSVLKYRLGVRAYNNYLIFKSVYFNTINLENLYSLYPDHFFDSNHYGIFFSIIIAPFAILPDCLGMILWNVVNTIVFLFAIYKLPFSDKKKMFFGLLCLQEFITSLISFQFNIALTGLIIFCIYIRKTRNKFCNFHSYRNFC